jgi:streptogramin lyase
MFAACGDGNVSSPAAGTIQEFSVPTTNGFPSEITAGPDGNIWFTEFYGDKIGRITPSGTVTEFPIPTARSNPPDYITSGPDGNLWFGEHDVNYADTIECLDVDATLSKVLDKVGNIADVLWQRSQTDTIL